MWHRVEVGERLILAASALQAAMRAVEGVIVERRLAHHREAAQNLIDRARLPLEEAHFHVDDAQIGSDVAPGVHPRGGEATVTGDQEKRSQAVRAVLDRWEAGAPRGVSRGVAHQAAAVVDVLRLGVDHLANGAFGDALAPRFDERPVAAILGEHVLAARLAGGAHQRLRLRERGHRRNLAEDMPPGFQGRDCLRRVHRHRRADDDAIQVVPHQVLILLVEVGDPLLLADSLQRRGVGIAHGNHLHPRVHRERIEQTEAPA